MARLKIYTKIQVVTSHK